MQTEIENAGLTVGEIIGHRVWRISESRFLYSCTHEAQWVPHDPMVGDPEKDGRGVHAFRERGEKFSAAKAEYQLMMLLFFNIGHHSSLRYPWACSITLKIAGLPEPPPAPPPMKFIGLAIGTVRLYGTVIEHAHGYRAQYAMVDGIDQVHGLLEPVIPDNVLLDQIRGKYGL